FYFFNFYKKKYGSDLNFYPGVGVDNMEALISLALGYGRDFIVLADDDAAGRAAVKRYRREFLLSNSCYVYGEVDKRFKGKKLEGLISNKTKAEIRKYFGIKKLQKRHFALFFAEKSSVLDYELDEETRGNVSTLLQKLRSMFQAT
ncbi:MAG: hypothetical protein AAF311_14075, partial [Pseudomonadota bacterium]